MRVHFSSFLLSHLIQLVPLLGTVVPGLQAQVCTALIYLFNPRTALDDCDNNTCSRGCFPYGSCCQYSRHTLKRVDGCPGSKALSPAVSSSTDGCAESAAKHASLQPSAANPTFFVPHGQCTLLLFWESCTASARQQKSARAAVGTDSRTGLSPANINTCMMFAHPQRAQLYRPPRWGSDKSWHRRSLRCHSSLYQFCFGGTKYVGLFFVYQVLCSFHDQACRGMRPEYVDEALVAAQFESA